MLLDNQLNGHPSVNFSVVNENSLKINHDGSLNSDYVSVFVIGRMNANSNSKGTYLVKTSGKSLDDGYGLIRLNSSEKVRFFSGNYGVNRDSEHFHYGLYDLVIGNYKTGSSSDKIAAMINNVGSSTSAVGTAISSNNAMYLGARPKNSTTLKSFLDGDIAEVIVINKDLPSTQRIIIANYLAAKYGFAISNSKYSFFASHPNDVVGIGRYDDYTHASSQAGVFELNEKTSNALANGSFLMVGHDGGSMNTITTNLPAEFSQRYTRTWRSHVNGYIKSENLRFHVGSGMPADVNDYALLLDLDGDGDFSNADVIAPTSVDASNNIVKFNNVHLHTGAVFTLAFYQAITWDGTTFANGSGPGEAPNSIDGGRNLIITGSGAPISENAAVYAVSVDSNSSMQLDSMVCLTVNSNIHNDGIINIAEDASLIQRTIGDDLNTGVGTYTLKQTGLNSEFGYNNWSSPMKHQGLGLAFPDVNPCDLITYSGFYQNWKYDFPTGYSTTCVGNPVTFSAAQSISGGDGYMDIARGYFITGNTTNPQKTFEGQVNNGHISALIVATDFGDNQNWDDDDWNFVGNPYPSALDPYAFWQENAIDNQRITDAIYFWDDIGTSGGAYDQYNDYASWNLTGGIASDNSPKIIDSLNHIAAGQGFMLWADTNGWDSVGSFLNGPNADTLYLDTIVFNNSMRSCKNNLFYKQQQETKELSWIQIESPSGQKSKFLLGTVEGATDAKDQGYDARRNRFNSNEHIELSSMILADTTSYNIQAIDRRCIFSHFKQKKSDGSR